MADNIKQNTIYVETDYDNIILIDPNKVVINNEVKDRLVDHEDLVYYVNLETKVIPRTKLAVGIDLETEVVSTTIASLEGKSKGDKINFLQPINKKAFDTSWSDQLTGKGAKEGLGANQTNERAVTDKDGNTRYIRNVSNYEDTQMLGMESVSLEITGGKTGGMFVPTVNIDLIDIQGRTLFEQGEKSLYSVFFNLPYPLFYLTIKGYYGKAIRYSLNLTNFSANFDQESGSFKIRLKLIGKNTGLISDSLLDYSKIAPKMFPTVIEQSTPSPTNSTNTNITETETTVGRQVLDEVYSIYKAKGLLDKNFPNLTIDEFIEDADSFQTSMQEKIEKGDFVILSDISEFRNQIRELKDRVYTVVTQSYLDTSNYIVKDGQIYYPFKNTIPFQKRRDIITAIKAEINNSLNNLRNNASFGKNSTNGNEIPVNITENEVFVENFNFNDLTEEDYKVTLAARTGTVPTDNQVQLFIAQINKDFETKELIKDVSGIEIESFPTLIKYGEKKIGSKDYVNNSFLSKIDILFSNLSKKETDIEQKLSDDLANQFFESDGGIGYKPTIRNIMAVLFAGLDTFYRLMNRTERLAWDKRENPKRISTVLPPEKSSGIEGKNSVKGTSESARSSNIVYPWPTYFVEETQDDGSTKYNIRYVGDPKYSDKTEAFDPSVWPEINFIENYLTASTKKGKEVKRKIYNNPKELAKYGSCNTLYFPFDTQPYENKSEIGFFYEFYERAYLLSLYPKLVKSTFKTKQIDKFLADLEAKNIADAVSDSPALKEKLKTKKYNLSTLRQELFDLSNNGGIGISWADFERDKYITDNLRNDIEKDYGLYDMSTINARSISLDNNIPLVKNFEEYLRSSNVSEFSFLDVLPFTDTDYVSGNTNSVDAKNFNETIKSFIFLDDKKTIARINETESLTNIKCFKDYTKQQFTNFSTNVFFDKVSNETINSRETLKNYFEQNIDKDDYLTVKRLKLNESYSGNVNTIDQRTTLFNTPYFINSLLVGVEKEKNNLENPYVALGYMYLNSLPLSELTDFLYDFGTESDADGFAATLKNFSAIHQIPYAIVLKYGSIWHRYKKYIDENVDILDDVWKDFDYKKYFDPFINNLSTNFKIKNYTGGTIDVSGFKTEPTLNSEYIETFNTGFYPKLINDFYRYFTKKDLFTNYNLDEFEKLYNENKLKIGLNTTASYFMPLSGDTNDNNRQIIINPFFQYMTFENDPLIDANNKLYLLIPSNGGTPFNQTVFECFNINNKITIDVKNNPAMYNGSVRSVWGASQYGYFDNNTVKKPNYNEYVDLSNSTFKSKYVEDIFSVFKPEILDLFEKAFLGFCKPNPTSEDIFFLENEVKSPTYTSTNKKFDCILKIGNAGNFDRKLFNSFLNEAPFVPKDPFKFEEPYILNSLPGDGQTTNLILSRSNFNKEWKTLEKYVGFSSIPLVDYTNSGSTITDFFIDNNLTFSENNIKVLYPIIKLYARHKYEAKKNNQTFTADTFKQLLRTFLTESNDLNNNIVTEISSYLNKNLPAVKTNNQKTVSTVEGDVTKLSLYNVFQAFNDKWISGSDLTSKTLFEDFLFHDVSNNDVGDKIQISMEAARDIFKSDNGTDILQIVGSLLKECGNMLFFSLPAYVNFYGIQSPSKNAQALDTDPANTMFNTWTNVDYTNSSAKFLCVFTGRESEKLPSRDNSFMIYGDDSYDFRNPSSNPLRIDDNKQNKSLSNKVVGFNVDFGIRNQNMFKSFEVGMDDKKNTSATFQVRTNLANGATGGLVAQQSTSLYSFYKSLSYTCTIKSFGNVMIQPLMYFNLRHVPLFYGPYYIFNVNHNITSNAFETTFKGSRMPKYALPQPDSLGTYIKANYLEKYKAQILERKNTEGQPVNYDSLLDPEQQTKEKQGLPSNQTVCQNTLNERYTTGCTFVNQVKTTLTYEDLKNLINDNVTDLNTKLALFTIALTRSTNISASSGMVEPLNKNYFELNAINDFGERPEFKQLICVESDGYPTPLFSFTGETDAINIAKSIINPITSIINDLKVVTSTTEDAIAHFVIVVWDIGEFGISAEQIKNILQENLQKGLITQKNYEANVNAAKIAQSYFT